ncbi:orotate phosphoribosyltransferase [Gammaproteobacteria bacterium]
MQKYQQDFIELSLAVGALRFGDFTLKSGRRSPYFFNTGLFSSGESVARLGAFYANAIIASGVEFDMLFGFAYKGIPLVVATGIALATQYKRNVPIAFNRKEVKDHGEGGTIVGAPLKGRVLILDDVISAGTSIRESMGLIYTVGAVGAGVVIALDRQERGNGVVSAVAQVEHELGLPVYSVVQLDHVLRYLEGRPELESALGAIRAYQAIYRA